MRTSSINDVSAKLAVNADTSTDLNNQSKTPRKITGRPPRHRKNLENVISDVLIKNETPQSYEVFDQTEINVSKDLGADKAFAKGVASIKSFETEQFDNKNKTLQHIQNHIKNLIRNVKNIFVGAMLVFFSCLPQFFEPIFFVIDNAKTIGKAALHVSIPFVMTWYIAYSSPVLQEFLFYNESMWMKMLSSVSLYSLSAITWIVCVLFTRSIFTSLRNKLNDFAHIGKCHEKKMLHKIYDISI